jgi:hypothetical protein
MITSTNRGAVATRAALVASSLLLGTLIASPADAQRPSPDCTTTLPASAVDDIGLVVAHRKEAAAQYLVDHWAEIAVNHGH